MNFLEHRVHDKQRIGKGFPFESLSKCQSENKNKFCTRPVVVNKIKNIQNLV